jgi:hypothetical protein
VNQPNAGAPGDWGGIYLGPTTSGSFDHVVFAYGGGVTRVEGGFANFNVLEIRQAKTRVANSTFEFNADGIRVLDPSDDPDRVGRGRNAPGVIYIQAAQPVVINNVIRGSTSTSIVPAITINANALNTDLVTDWGRATGPIDRYLGMLDNQGPLFRDNILINNPQTPGAINGLLVRGNVLTTASVWDDTDIVHVLLNQILVPDFHSKGGLRLESGRTESLVIKLSGANAGFTANGRPLDIDDRIGGSLHVVGQPGHPVVFTSLADDTVGAGRTMSGLPQMDTNGDGGASAPQPGDWRGLSLMPYANDRNVEIVTEREANDEDAPGLNAVPENAQFLGELAPGQLAGDDVRRLGFEVHGFLSGRNDIDTYSFRARSGTEVWFDIDNTTHSLDTVIELVDANGVVIARSDNSLDESANPSLLFVNTARIPRNHVNPLNKSAFGIADHYSTNPGDAGMRIVLPGSSNTVGTYHIRVRSANPGVAIPNDQLLGGRSMGRYQLQIRLQEMDEVPGSTVTYSEIRFASTAIDIQGLPRHSPLMGEIAETSANNQTRANAQEIGNILRSDRGAISVAGFLDANNPNDPVNPNVNQPNPNDPDDVDWYTFTIDYDSLQFPTGQGAGVIFDLDFADNLGRPDIRLSVFDFQGRLILSSNDANISDDISAPGGGTGAHDPARGSGGPLDAYIGPIQLRGNDPTTAVNEGRYYVAVSHVGDVPTELASIRLVNPANPLVRLEPLESVVRIAEDHIGSQGGSTVQPQRPLTPLFGGGAGTFVPFNLSDVVLFVSSSVDEQTNINIVDAFSGNNETFVGQFNFGTSDIAMRGDGTLYSYSVHRVGLDAPNDARQGNFLQINTGNGSVINLRDDGIETFEPDANFNPIRTHPFPPPNGGRIGHGITFHAMAFNRTGTQLFAAGNRGAFYGPGADYVTNILYRMEGSDVDGDGLAAGLPDPVAPKPNPLGRAGTNVLDQGEIPTAIDLVGGGASVLVAPPASSLLGNVTQFVINDGDMFEVQVDDGFGNLTPPVTFEFNSGPEATINFNLAAGEFFVDGEFFILDGMRFEFDTGRVLVPNGFQPGQLTEGAQIEIRDNAATPNVRVFEITTDAVVQPGAIPLVVTPQTTEAQFVSQIFVPAVNQQFATTTFNAQAILSNGRVTLTGDTFVVLRGGNTGFALSGNYGVSAGAFRIIAEETFQPGEIIQQILNTLNGVPGSPTNPVPGVPGIEAGAFGSRINFVGAVNGDFDSNDTTTAALPGTPRFMTGVPGSDGNFTGYEIPFFASDTGEDIAARIIAAINDVATDNTINDPADRFDPNLAGVIANATVPPSRTVRLTVDPAVFPNPNAAAQVNLPPNSPFTLGGTAPGGFITGMAFVGNQLYAVSTAGGLYHILTPNQVAFRDPITTNTFVNTDYIESAVDLAALFDPTPGSLTNPQGRQLTGLTEGPPNLQGGAFADLLFGLDNLGRMYAFDTNGTLQPIFQGGATFVDTGINAASGLAFSTLDYNPWHVTNFEAGDPFRWMDQGHGIEPTSTLSRIVRNPGNASLYFGNALRDISPQFQGLQTINREGRQVTSLGQEAGDRLTYDFPGGAHGSAQSAAFSLKGYGAADQPVLYFNYFLDTENANSTPGNTARDTFRVFAASDDPSLPSDPIFRGNVVQGQWYLLATNNAATTAAGTGAPLDGPSPFAVETLHDSTGSWRQARIDLSPFAGLENIRLRFDFSTAGSMDTPEIFGSDTGGEELKILPGSALRDGQTFRIDGTTFEFDLGVTLLAPTGNAIADGETFTINDGLILPVNFEFDNDNNFRRNIRTSDGSFFRDGDTFTITDGTGRTQPFEFESGFTLVVPQQGGILDGDRFSIDDDANGPNPPVVFEFDYRTGIDPLSDAAIDVITDVAIIVPPTGGTPLTGINDGDTFTIDDDGPGPNPPTVFEFDSNGVVTNPNAFPVSYISGEGRVSLAVKLAAAINAAGLPGINAAHVGNGEVRIGSPVGRVNTGGSANLTQQNIVGSYIEIADRIVQAIQDYQANVRNLGLAPLHTSRAGVLRGEIHLGGTVNHRLDTSLAAALRQRGAPGLTDSNAIAVPYIPDDSFTAQNVAAAIAAAVNQAASQGFGVSATVANNVVILSGANFQFSPGATALTTDLVIPIPFTSTQSAEEVAAAVAAAIANTQLNVTTHLVGDRINLENLTPANPLTVIQSPGTGSAVPGLTLDGRAGATVGIPIPIHAEMTVAQVRDAVAEVLNRTFAPAADQWGSTPSPLTTTWCGSRGTASTTPGRWGPTPSQRVTWGPGRRCPATPWAPSTPVIRRCGARTTALKGCTWTTSSSASPSGARW